MTSERLCLTVALEVGKGLRQHIEAWTKERPCRVEGRSVLLGLFQVSTLQR